MISRLTGAIFLVIMSHLCMAFTIANNGHLEGSFGGINFFITIQPNIYAFNEKKAIYKVTGLDACRVEIEISPGVKGECDDNVMFRVKQCDIKRNFLHNETDRAIIYEYMIVGIRVSGKAMNTKKTYFRNAVLTQYIKYNVNSIVYFEISGDINSLSPTVIINDGEYILDLERGIQ